MKTTEDRRRAATRYETPKATLRWLGAVALTTLLVACGSGGPPEPEPEPAQQHLNAINAVRTTDSTCDGTDQPATEALTLNPTLSQAALLHAQAMAGQGGAPSAHGYYAVDHTHTAGYPAIYASLYFDLDSNRSPQERIDLIMSDPGTCLDLNFTGYRDFGFAVDDDYLAFLVATPRPITDAQFALNLINGYRAAGHTCGTVGDFPPVGPMVLQDDLITVSQTQAEYMLSIGEATDLDADERNPQLRVTQDTDYAWERLPWVYARFPNVSGFVNWLFNEDGVDWACALLMDPDIVDLGVGRAGSYFELLMAEPATD